MAVSRVRLIEATKVYWPRTCMVLELAKDEEVIGELADYLASACPTSVEVFDDAAEKPPADPDAIPDGTAADVLAWVSDDRDKAGKALEAELAKEKPRSTLVAALEKLAVKEPE